MSSTIFNHVKAGWQHAGFQKYFKNTGWALFGKVFSLGVSFITSIYVIRHLGPSNYGLLTFSVSFVSLFSFIASLGVDSVLYRELSKDISKKDELIGTALFLKVIASCVAILAIWVTMFLVNTDAITKLLIAINSCTLLFASFTVIGYYFQAKVQARYQAISLIGVTLILNTLKVLVLYFNKGMIYFAFVLFLEYILYALFTFYFYSRSGNRLRDLTVKSSVACSLLKDSWPLMLSSAFIIIYTRIDQVMLKFITTDFNVGIYDAAARISEVWYFIPALIISSVFPAIINAQKVDVAMFTGRLTKLYSVLFYMSFLVALPITFLSDMIIRTIYGPAFIQAGGVLSIYVWAGIPVFISMAVNTYLLAENKNTVAFVSSVIGMVTNVLLNLWFIPLYGVYGAAYATLISYSLVPLSVILFKDTRGQLVLIKNGITMPFVWFAKTVWK